MIEKMMRICLLSPHCSAPLAALSPGQFLEAVPLYRHLAQALASYGHRVEVVQQFPQAVAWSEGDVHYHFVPAGKGMERLARAAGRVSGRHWERALLAVPPLLRAKALRPDVIHFHGLLLTLNLSALWLLLGPEAPPVVAHYHGGLPSHNSLWRRFQTHSMQRLHLALFSTCANAQPFVAAGLLQREQVAELMEVSSHFRMRPRAQARATTGMAGAPVFVWAGRLHPLKDPLTALRGFAQIRAAWPEAQLYLYYLSDELLPELTRFVAGQPGLAAHVHFRGAVPHDRMEAVFNSADFLLQASRREYSGYAVLEAMACGTIPVVSEIPSFRRMTDEGRFGILFPPGDAGTLARRVLAIDREQIPAQAAAIRHRFEQTFSFEAMATMLLALYQQETVR